MLKASSSLVTYHLQAINHSLNLLSRKPLATLMTAMVIALALALPALFWVFTDNLSQLATGWQRGGHISLYLTTDLSQQAQDALLQQIQRTQGVGNAVLKSPEEGLAELTQQEGMQDIMRYLPENPLPPMIEVVPSLTIDSPAKMNALYQELQSLGGVEEAKLDMEWINRLHVILSFVAKIANALLSLLALAVIFIVGNTLRLSIQNRQEEIQILKINWRYRCFYFTPFLIFWGVVWAFGAVLAVLFVNIFYP